MACMSFAGNVPAMQLSDIHQGSHSLLLSKKTFCTWPCTWPCNLTLGCGLGVPASPDMLTWTLHLCNYRSVAAWGRLLMRTPSAGGWLRRLSQRQGMLWRLAPPCSPKTLCCWQVSSRWSDAVCCWAALPVARHVPLKQAWWGRSASAEHVLQNAEPMCAAATMLWRLSPCVLPQQCCS